MSIIHHNLRVLLYCNTHYYHASNIYLSSSIYVINLLFISHKFIFVDHNLSINYFMNYFIHLIGVLGFWGFGVLG